MFTKSQQNLLKSTNPAKDAREFAGKATKEECEAKIRLYLSEVENLQSEIGSLVRAEEVSGMSMADLIDRKDVQIAYNQLFIAELREWVYNW